jgi:Flp pilus assembly protein TadB
MKKFLVLLFISVASAIHVQAAVIGTITDPAAPSTQSNPLAAANKIHAELYRPYVIQKASRQEKKYMRQQSRKNHRKAGKGFPWKPILIALLSIAVIAGIIILA